MSAVALPPLPGASSALTAMPGRRERVLVPWRLGALLLTGLLGAAAFPIAFPVGPRRELFASGILEPLAFVCLVPMLLAIRRLSPWRAFAAGMLGGMVFFTGAFWWVNVAMVTFGGMPNWLSIPALELLVAWCAFHWGIAAGLLRLIERGLGWSMGWTVGPVWMATELMRNYFCSGFPWANLGYTQTRNLWFHQVASLGGVYAVALAVAVVNGALYEGWRWWRLRERPTPRVLLAVGAAVLMLGHVYGAFHVRAMDRAAAAAPRVKAAVVQGNIDQKLKMSRGSSRAATILGRYLPPTAAADEAGAELVIWPEGSYPLAFPTGVTRLTDAGLRSGGYRAGVLIGVDVFDPKNLRKGNENAAFLLDPSLGVAHHYVKNHLVPFGEYVPWRLDEVLGIGNIVGASFAPGNDLSPALLRRPEGPPVRAGYRDLLRRHLPGDLPHLRPERSAGAGEHDQRRLVRLQLGAVPVPPHGRHPRGGDRKAGGPCGQHRRQRLHRSGGPGVRRHRPGHRPQRPAGRLRLRADRPRVADGGAPPDGGEHSVRCHR